VARCPKRAVVVVVIELALGAFLPSVSSGQVSGLKAMWGPSTRNGVSLFPLYHDLGVRIYEDKLPWAAITPTSPRHPTDPRDPAYAWPAEVTQAVAEAKRYHMQVALQIIGAPAWANGGKPWNWAPSELIPTRRGRSCRGPPRR
jgi:hypothetical protein